MLEETQISQLKPGAIVHGPGCERFRVAHVWQAPADHKVPARWYAISLQMDTDGSVIPGGQVWHVSLKAQAHLPGGNGCRG